MVFRYNFKNRVTTRAATSSSMRRCSLFSNQLKSLACMGVGANVTANVPTSNEVVMMPMRMEHEAMIRPTVVTGERSLTEAHVAKFHTHTHTHKHKHKWANDHVL